MRVTSPYDGSTVVEVEPHPKEKGAAQLRQQFAHRKVNVPLTAGERTT